MTHPRLLVAPLCLAAGCALLAQAHVRKYDRQVQAYERVQPDAKALGRDDIASTSHMTSEMDDWAGYIRGQGLPKADVEKLVARLEVAKRRYYLAAGKLTQTPDIGFYLAMFGLIDGDAAALAEVRELSAKRAARRQTLFGQTHTYSLVVPGQMAMADLGGSESIVNGRVVEQSSSVGLVAKPGNCVFATRPFGAEGTPNPALTFRLVGKAPSAYVRCYIDHDLDALPGREAALVVTIPVGIADNFQTTVPIRPSAGRYVDFKLDRGFVDDREPFSRIMIDLSWHYTNDLVVVWEDGANRLRKERKTIDLAATMIFWDRDGTPD
jgi:hypothetical protein